MKFGRTLYEKVSEEWHPYVVDYRGMTLVLEGDTSRQLEKIDPAEINQDEFFRMYELSKKGITRFYLAREQWALEQMTALMRRVEDLRQTSNNNNSPMSESSSERSTRDAIAAFESELELLLGFLALNHTGFSKILKKFDKRTGSCLRETKLAELQLSHPFLDGGGDIGKMKEQLPGLTARLDRVIDRRTRLVRRAKNNERAQIMRTNRLLQQMKTQSPFFNPHDGTAPRELKDYPLFNDKEVVAGKDLGEGEFNTVSEVRQFLVSDRCHICFLHRGYHQHTNATTPTTNTNSHHENEGNEDYDHGSTSGSTTAEGGGGCSTSKSGTASWCGGSHNRSKIAPLNILPSAEQPVPSTFLSKTKQEDDDDEISAYDEIDDSDHEEEEYVELSRAPHITRGYMKDHCLRNNAARYAIKRLRDDVINGDDKEFMADAAVDLACEAAFLAALAHPNIIKMRGTSGEVGHPKFGIILDRLYHTLTEQSREVWSGKSLEMPSSQSSSAFGGVFFRRCKQRKMLKEWQKSNWVDRVAAMYDVSRAMRHLHGHNIVFRDLKPDNIGIDIRGDVKIFDFGLAKEFKEADRVGDTDQYRASGLTGTRRYMAPEVVKCEPYGLSIDVYSFAICLWEILALKVPFIDYEKEKHAKLVAYGGQRPKIPSSWPSYLRSIMVNGWSAQPEERGQFRDITSRLEIYLHTLSVDYSDRSLDLLNRSMGSRDGDESD